MTTTIKTIFIVLLITITCSFVKAADSSSFVNVSYNVDFVSRYVWRGQDLNGSPAIQPTFAVSKSIFTLGVWGSYAINPQADNYSKEADLYLTVAPLSFLSVTLTDYFSIKTDDDPSYFKYSKDETAHVFEAMATLTFGSFGFVGAYNFYGADTDKSIYLEANYKTKDFLFFIGATPTECDEFGYYNTGTAGVSNIGFTYTKVLDFAKLPTNLKFSLISNPNKEKLYAVVGIGF